MTIDQPIVLAPETEPMTATETPLKLKATTECADGLPDVIGRLPGILDWMSAWPLNLRFVALSEDVLVARVHHTARVTG